MKNITKKVLEDIIMPVYFILILIGFIGVIVGFVFLIYLYVNNFYKLSIFFRIFIPMGSVLSITIICSTIYSLDKHNKEIKAEKAHQRKLKINRKAIKAEGQLSISNKSGGEVSLNKKIK